MGLGARVTLVDVNLNRLRELDDIFGGRLYTLASNSYNIGRAVREADLVIGGVLIPGAAAPKLVTKAMVAKMKKGAVIVDVAIDQGGCIETARPTTHSDPSYVVDGVVHYCVTNMPAAVPNTSTLALTNATFPYLMKLAKLGANCRHPGGRGHRRGSEHIQWSSYLQAGRGVAAPRLAAGLRTGGAWRRRGVLALFVQQRAQAGFVEDGHAERLGLVEL